MELALKATPAAREAFAPKKFPDLVRNLHACGIYRTNKNAAHDRLPIGAALVPNKMA